MIVRDVFNNWMTAHSGAAVRMVSGMRGTGKTAALIAWAQQHSLPTGTNIWVSADQALTDPGTFWGLVVDRLQTAGVSVDPALMTALSSGTESGPGYPSLLLRQFERTGPALFVVDEWEHLTPTAVVEDLARLVQHVHDLHVVLAGRTSDIPAAWSGLRDHIAITPSDLLTLSVAEIDELARLQGIRLSPAQLTELHSVTGGWAAGVRAELGNLGTRAELGVATRRIGPQLLEPFLSRPEYATLRSLAVAEFVDLDVLDVLRVPETESLMLLDELAGAGLGLWEPHPERASSIFRMHSLFRDALRDEARRGDPVGPRQASGLLARLHFERAEFQAAFISAAAAEDWGLAARIYRRHLSTAIDRHSRGKLPVHDTPAAARRTYPILELASLLDNFSGGHRLAAIRQMLTLLAASQRRRLTGRQPTVDDVWMQGIVSLCLRLLGRYGLAYTTTHRLHSVLETVDDPDHELDEAMPLLLTHSATTLIFADRLVEALNILGEAGDPPLPEQPASERARVLGAVALVLVLHGEVIRARSVLDAYDQLPLPLAYHTTYSAITRALAGAYCALEAGDPTTVLGYLEAAETHRSTTEFWPFILEIETQARWQIDGASAALDYLDGYIDPRAAKLPKDSPVASRLHVLRVDLLLAAGRFREAHEHLHTSEHRSTRLSVARERVELITGNPVRARERAIAALQRAEDPRDALALRMIIAAASHRLNDPAAETTGVDASNLATRTGLRLPLAGVPQRDAASILQGNPSLRRDLSRIGIAPREPETFVKLSNREKVVLLAIAEGGTVAEMAAALHVSENTIKTQLKSLYRKLEVTTRHDAIARAAELDLL